MSRYISLDGITDAFDSLKSSVKPSDVAVGFLAGKVGGKYLGSLIAKNVWAKVPSVPDFLKRQDVTDLLGSTLIGLLLYVAQKGSARAKGHFVGAVGGAAVDVAANQVAAMLPMAAYVSYDGMGILTQDNSFGILTQDNSFGGLTYEEPTEAELSAFADYSHNNMNDAVEDGY